MWSKQRCWLWLFVAIIGCERPVPPPTSASRPLPAEVSGDPESALPPRSRTPSKNKR